ncbi:MAG: glucitol operon activator protein [Thermosediminibacterales bacterium]|nr:glucitol operon activator protein [Thermosediminibacterales bacterium]MDK2835839.1 glucitol operon activator protein [Thermosediminibacterales bacterium]
MWVRIMALIAGLWLIQVVLTYFQIKHYQKRIIELKRKGRVGIGSLKGKLTPGVIIILAVNPGGAIVDAEIMKGISVFARFKKYKELIGQNINDLTRIQKKLKEKEIKALKMAVENLQAAIN